MRNKTLIKYARRLRKDITDTENEMWKHLRNRHLMGMKFRRQYPIGKYILDFACVEKKVGIELDGGQHAIMQAKDRERDLFLKDKGYSIIRVWNNESLKNTEAILGYIVYELNKKCPHPDPLPQAGEGIKRP